MLTINYGQRTQRKLWWEGRVVECEQGCGWVAQLEAGDERATNFNRRGADLIEVNCPHCLEPIAVKREPEGTKA